MGQRIGLAALCGSGLARCLITTDVWADTVKVSGGGTVGPLLSENRIVAPDDPKHTMTLARRTEPNTSTDPHCQTMHVEFVTYAEIVAGTGYQRGHRTQICPSGDTWFSTYHGTVTTTPKQGGAPDVTGEGTWQIIGGTGRYQDARGEGTYKGRLTCTPGSTRGPTPARSIGRSLTGPRGSSRGRAQSRPRQSGFGPTTSQR
jgi:hypothetical protein